MLAERVSGKSSSALVRHIMRRDFSNLKSYSRITNDAGGDYTRVLNLSWYDGPLESEMHDKMSVFISGKYCWLTPRGDIVLTDVDIDKKTLLADDIVFDDEPMLGSHLVAFPFGSLNLTRLVSLKRINRIIKVLVDHGMPKDRLEIVNKGESYWAHDNYSVIYNDDYEITPKDKKIDWIERAKILMNKKDV